MAAIILAHHDHRTPSEIFEAARKAHFAVTLHEAADFDGMRRAGRLAAEVLDLLVPLVKPGVTTEALDKVAYDYVVAHGATPACLGYRGYRHTVCTSINHVVCHGIPGDKPLRDGDIVNIDVTVILDGWHGDTQPDVSGGRRQAQSRAAGRDHL